MVFLTGSATAAGQPAKDLSWNGSSAAAVTTFYVAMSQGNLNSPSLSSAGTAAPYTGLSSSYQGILGLSGVGATQGTATIGGLTSGRAYAVQALANNSSAGNGNYNTTWSSTAPGSAGTSILSGQFDTAAGNVARVDGRLGTYMISGFTANGTNQNFVTTCNNALRFTAVQVRDVTGYWSGQAATGAWDTTSRNFTGGNDSSGAGGMTFTNVGNLGVNSVVFADMDGFARQITQNTIAVQAGGVATGSVRFENEGIDYTFNNASGTIGITGSTQLVHNGTGRVVLNSENTYSGGTVVNSGTLVVNNTTGSGTGTGTLTVAEGARLEGSGIIGSFTAISGTHAPGNSPGTETFTNGLSYNSTSVFDWELTSSTTEGRGTNWDAVNLTTTGTLSVDPDAIYKILLGAAVDFNAPFWSSTQTWSVFEASSGATISSIFQNFEVIGGTNYNSSLGSFSMLPTGTLVWAAIPETTTALAGLLLVAGLLRRRRN